MDYDVIIVGSGFGGSVCALRLTEKGYRVAVLEQGRRFQDADLHQSTVLLATCFGCRPWGCRVPSRNALCNMSILWAAWA